MNITLPPNLEEYVRRRSQSAGYGSPEAVVCEAIRRLMEEESQHEEAVLEAMKKQPKLLTVGDLAGVRDFLKEAPERRW